ncbi:MAG: FAD-dependent monooxygenase [Gammaproteobacteria bacterium]|nr:FAD-dependent monooxygenase [Gammaproteobacteria bacterium]
MSAGYEVIVAGGGPVGATLAALLQHRGGLAAGRVALLEPAVPAAAIAGADPQLRVAAISRAGERVLRAAGVWQQLDGARLCAYERMRIWHESSSPWGRGVLEFRAAELAEPDLGHIIENQSLQAAAMAALRESGGVHVAAALERFDVQADGVRVQAGGERLDARLLVGADGARSAVRAGLGLEPRLRAYGQRAIVATVATAEPHAATAWQRFLGSGPLALLPLFDGRCSIVWSADDALADELLALDAAAFARRLTLASDGVLGEVRLASRRLAFPLRSLALREYVRPRCALVGDAAHVIHPLAGQGMNLGLLDAAALCEAVAIAGAQREDPGAMRILRGYQQARRTHNLATDAAMSLFNAGLSQPEGVGGWLAGLVLGGVNRSGLARRFFMQQALGLSGELPALARTRAA